MSKYVINDRSIKQRTIEATSVEFVNDFVVFSNGNEMVFACPKAGLYYIELVDE